MCWQLGALQSRCIPWGPQRITGVRAAQHDTSGVLPKKVPKETTLPSEEKLQVGSKRRKIDLVVTSLWEQLWFPVHDQAPAASSDGATGAAGFPPPLPASYKTAGVCGLPMAQASGCSSGVQREPRPSPSEGSSLSSAAILGALPLLTLH